MTDGPNRPRGQVWERKSQYPEIRTKAQNEGGKPDTQSIGFRGDRDRNSRIMDIASPSQGATELEVFC